MKGSISISRQHSSHKEDQIVITLTDEVARVQFAEIEISLENLARALTCSPVEGELSVRALELVGTRAENKEEFVPVDSEFNSNYKTRREQAKRLLKNFEVDGWKAAIEDLGNPHRGSSVAGYSVRFFRNVKI